MRVPVVVMVVALGGTAHANPRSYSLPSMVVTPSENVAYVLAAGGIAAVEVSTGKVKWKSKLAVRPIGRTADTLVALDPKGNAIVLDAKTGAQHTTCPTLSFALALRDHHGHYNSSSWHAISEDKTIKINWRTSSNSWRSGVRPTKEQEIAAQSSSSGVHEIDVATCKVTSRPGPPPDTSAIRLTGTTPNTTKIQIVEGATLRAKRSRAGQALAEIDFKDGGRVGWRFSLTDQHLIVHNWDRMGKLVVFDLEGGQRLGEVHTSDLAYAFVVVGNHLVFEARAVDLGTGTVTWTYDVATPVRERHEPLPKARPK